ncbi:hypothetical protein [Anatilimnocola floriformis]|uniref:hypothetical protein n=1 Tax=Anatilimnocola floriformis TaxID=2948575 RepID=UPI0020C47164|nr:hypothetical protein [Anatilimnocola floriformis]
MSPQFQAWVLSISLALLLGCSGQRTAPPDEVSIKALTIQYGRFFQTHQGKPPANEAEFKAFVEKVPAAELAAQGCSDPTKLWTSARDGQPYVVTYGAASNPSGPSGPVVIYEKAGAGGRRFVGTSLGNVEEVDDARFRELVPNPISTP